MGTRSVVDVGFLPDGILDIDVLPFPPSDAGDPVRVVPRPAYAVVEPVGCANE